MYLDACSRTHNLCIYCSHWPTFPQIFINGEFIGGSDIILNMHQVISLVYLNLVRPSKNNVLNIFFMQSGELKEKLKTIAANQGKAE